MTRPRLYEIFLTLITNSFSQLRSPLQCADLKPKGGKPIFLEVCRLELESLLVPTQLGITGMTGNIWYLVSQWACQPVETKECHKQPTL